MLADQLSIIVNRQPDSIAIKDSRRGSITYKELWEYLQATSAALDARLDKKLYVAVIADQDAFAVIACIATMITGRIIIPIDPRHSPPLTEQMLAPFTHDILSEKPVNINESFATILFDDIIKKFPIEYAFNSSNTDTYILHTSGTTGLPKPALADQAALLHVATALADRYFITPQSKVLQFAYLSFDSSLVEIWSTLLSGGTIVIAGESLRNDLYGCLESLLQEGAITTATLPSSVASNLDVEYLRSLNTLILAGDECPINLANSLYPHIPHLINAYGPTESIICSTTFEITSPQKGRVPIGSPLPGMNIIIDNPDSDGRGEMLLSSSYIAKGYAHNHELTENKFQLHNGKLSYKSGDIGRLNNEGYYEFLGRVDNQVKINGQRIELEGVEAHIRSVTKNNATAVIGYDDKLYCIYQATKTQTEFINLKETLNGSLPEYAIPHICLPIEKLPLDLNGKINRKALQEFVAQNIQRNQTVNTYMHPDEGMIKLWSEVLKISHDSIQPNTNFFSVGGDSLDALRLVKVINNHYQSSVKLSDIIKSPTTPESMLNVVNSSIGEVRS